MNKHILKKIVVFEKIDQNMTTLPRPPWAMFRIFHSRIKSTLNKLVYCESLLGLWRNILILNNSSTWMLSFHIVGGMWIKLFMMFFQQLWSILNKYYEWTNLPVVLGRRAKEHLYAPNSMNLLRKDMSWPRNNVQGTE